MTQDTIDELAQVYPRLYLHYLGYTLFYRLRTAEAVVINGLNSIDVSDSNTYFERLFRLASIVHGYMPRQYVPKRTKEFSRIRVSKENADDFVYMKIYCECETALNEIKDAISLAIDNVSKEIDNGRSQTLLNTIKEYYNNLTIHDYISLVKALRNIVCANTEYRTLVNAYSQASYRQGYFDLPLLSKLFFDKQFIIYVLAKFIFKDDTIGFDHAEHDLTHSLDNEFSRVCFIRDNYALLFAVHNNKLFAKATLDWIEDRYPDEIQKAKENWRLQTLENVMNPWG